MSPAILLNVRATSSVLIALATDDVVLLESPKHRPRVDLAPDRARARAPARASGAR